MVNSGGGHPEIIRRRKARSGIVDYSNEVVIDETSSRKIVLVPYYIPNSQTNQFSATLKTFTKDSTTGQLQESNKLSLDQQAIGRLLNGLKTFLAISTETSEGDYVVIKVQDGVADAEGFDTKIIASAVTSMISRPEIVQQLNLEELSNEIISAIQTFISLNSMRSAVHQLRDLLESGESSESVYQDWCDRYSWAFGNAYVLRDEIHNISAGDHIDMLLPTVMSGYRDIVELKRPDMSVLRYDETHRDHYWSADVSKAIGQCHRYLDTLHEYAAHGLRDYPEIVAYHPRAIIVIGRSNKFGDHELRSLRGLNHRLSGISIMTYDQLLAQGERLIQSVSQNVNQVIEDVNDLPF